MICVYCNRDSEAFTAEHVIPQSIGGNLYPKNPFKLKEVCSNCNSCCGRYVDGPFIRSWMTQQNRARTAVRALKPGPSAFLPLNYFGVLENVEFGSRICEFWLGPTKDRIYHFHEPYPREADSPIIVGLPPHLPKDRLDAGFVFLFVRSNNPVWWPVIFNSVVKQFAGSQLFLGNGPMPPGGAFSAIPSELFPLHGELKALDGVEHKTKPSLSLDYGSRFLAKLTLGMGGLFLDRSFRSSESADLLRKFLWTKKIGDRQKIPVSGRNFAAEKDPNFAKLAAFLRWPGGHILVMVPTPKGLMLYAAFFEAQAATIVISNERDHWQNIGNNDGVVHVISPGLRKYAGPLKLSAFITHRMLSPDPALKDLEDQERQSPLPPFDL
jgi:HNH endonuclease